MGIKKISKILLVLIVATISFGGLQSFASVENPAIGNKMICPVRGEEFELMPQSESVEYKGKTYYFCCPMCKSQFEKHLKGQISGEVKGSAFKRLNIVQNIHPLVVHFPIGLLIASFLFDILGFISRKQKFNEIAKFNLFLGTFAAIVALLSGLKAELLVKHGREIHNIMQAHKGLAFWIVGLAACLSIWRWKSNIFDGRKWAVVYLVFFLILVLLLSMTAHLGGGMVYDYGVGTSVKLTPPGYYSPVFKEDVNHEHKH